MKVRASARCQDSGGRNWLRTKVGTEASDRHFILSVPEEFSHHICEEGMAHGAHIFAALCDAVSGLPFHLSPQSGIAEAQKLLSAWFGFADRPRPPIRKTIAAGLYLPQTPTPSHNAAGLLFSGGVDATFTLTWLKEQQAGRLLALSIIHSEDGLPEPHQLALYESYRRALAAHDVDLIFVATNIMTCNDRVHDLWAFATHGGCMAAVAHSLSKQVDRWFISSSHDLTALIPWGSHPLLDPQYSSDRVSCTHFGAEFTRFEKILGIVHGPVGSGTLAVCGDGVQGGAWINCSRCQKCLRTMMALDLAGAREQSISFDWSGYSLAAVRSLRLRGRNEVIFVQELIRAAVALGRNELHAALDHVLRKSWLHRRLYRIEVYLRMKLRSAQRFKAPLKRLKRLIYR